MLMQHENSNLNQQNKDLWEQIHESKVGLELAEKEIMRQNDMIMSLSEELGEKQRSEQ